MIIDNSLIDNLFSKAEQNPRLRQNLDMRTSPEDGSQRMLNALLPGTRVQIHRHPLSSETVILLRGRLDEVIYEEVPASDDNSPEQTPDDADSQECKLIESNGRKTMLREVARYRLSPADGLYGCQVPKGAWHTVEVLEPSVIFEAKDIAYGSDGSETY